MVDSIFPEAMTSSNEDKGPLVLGSILAAVVLATLFVLARLYVRGFILKRFFLDDYFVCVGLLCAWLAVGLQIVAIENGFGRHIYTLSDEDRMKAVKFTTIAYVPGVLSFGIPKLAVVALLTRVLASVASTWHRAFLWVLAITCNTLLVLVALFVLLQCRPLHVLWDPTTKGTCWKRDVQIKFSIFVSSFSAATDLYLAVYPTIVLAKLRISRFKKLMLSLALGLGFISAIMAIYRSTLIPRLAIPDMTYAVVGLTIWTIVEGCTVAIATTIPVLQPLIRKLRGSDSWRANMRNKARTGNMRRHQRLRGGSDHTHIGRDLCGHDDSIYMGGEMLVTKCSVPDLVYNSGLSRSHLRYQRSGNSVAVVSTQGQGGITSGTTTSATTLTQPKRFALTSMHSYSSRRGVSIINEQPETGHGILRTDEVEVCAEERVLPPALRTTHDERSSDEEWLNWDTAHPNALPSQARGNNAEGKEEF